MPAYRFSWTPFDDATVRALAVDIGYRGAADGARDYLAAKVRRPNDEFVRTTKKTVESHWLPQHSRVAAGIVRELFDLRIGPMGVMPADAKGCAQYVSKCRNSSGVRQLLLERLIGFGDIERDGEWDGTGDFVPRFGIVVPEKQALPRLRPFPHQEEAWTALDRHLREARSTGVFKGLLVMPTGSGKTHTAVDWLMRNWIGAHPDNHILWIAHRDELLKQAARSFTRLAGVASKRKQLRIRLVSGRYCGFDQIDTDADDIILCSVNSLARAVDRAEPLLQNPRLFVVIDEAHHSPAKSYRSVINVLEGGVSHHLLGLTATPTRTDEDERPELARLFGERILYQVKASGLIARELLARPVPITVATGVDAEKDMTAVDLQHLTSFHDLSADMRTRLGADERRNHVIVKHYLANREKYGKTLVFTTDVPGAALLAEAFRAQLPEGVTAEYVASYRPDAALNERREDGPILERFRDRKSGLDVLINVEVLTEGVDLPMTRTVFLARPTSSEILLRQMIGRALRGPASGGNREAYIVSFDDHWSVFRDVLSPIDLLNEMLPDTELVGPETAPAVGTAELADVARQPQPSWEQIQAFSRAIRVGLPDPESDLFEAVPHGMFVVEHEAEGEAQQNVIHVYEHQRSCWAALFEYVTSLPTAERAALDVEHLDAEFFGDCDPPAPSQVDIGTVLISMSQNNAAPPYVPLEGRHLCDPRALAQTARDLDLRTSEIEALLTERHTALAKVIYPSMLDFRRAFDDAVREIQFPGEAARPKGEVLFEPPPGNPMRPGPHHDLDRLFDEMLSRGGQLLNEPISHDSRPEWTRRKIKGWYGAAYPAGPRAGHIRINCLLDSPDFSEETLRFLLWHEYLHLRLPSEGHGEQFRQLERLWPDYMTCDREMDSLNERFGVQYW